MARARSWQIVFSTLVCFVRARVNLPALAQSEGCSEREDAQQVSCLLKAWGRTLDNKKKIKDPFLDVNSPTYDASRSDGEISPTGVVKIMDGPADMGHPIGPEDIFADLGSGQGGLAIQVALCSSAATVIGVELAISRHLVAVALQSKLNNAIGDSAGIDLRFIHGDILDASSWMGSTVVFSNGFVFTPKLDYELRAVLLHNLLPGALILSTKRFSGCRDDLFRSLGSFKVEATWAVADVYVYMRVPNLNTVVFSAPAVSRITGGFEACVDQLLSSINSNDAVSERLCAAIHGPTRAWVTELGKESLVRGLGTACAAREISYLSGAAVFEGNKSELMDFVRKAPWRVGQLGDDDSLFLYLVELNRTMHIAKQMEEYMAKNGRPERLKARTATIPAELDDITGMLISARANTNSIGGSGRSPLHVAPTRNVTKLLLSAAADVHARDSEGNTPMHTAPCGIEQPASVTSELFQGGADINAVNLEGATPLHSAARCSAKAKLLKSMLSLRADPSLKDASGKIPAEYVSNSKVRGLLRADPSVKDASGKIPAEYVSNSKVRGTLQNIDDLRAHLNEHLDEL